MTSITGILIIFIAAIWSNVNSFPLKSNQPIKRYLNSQRLNLINSDSLLCAIADKPDGYVYGGSLIFINGLSQYALMIKLYLLLTGYFPWEQS